jgi:hypothetical protein
MKTTKMKSVKDNERGVNNDHVSHSNTQNCDANSCTVWLKNYVLSSPDKRSKMVPGYVLHITTKLGSKKKVTNSSHCTHSTPYTNLKIM